jgi:hypothetical protein
VAPSAHTGVIQQHEGVPPLSTILSLFDIEAVARKVSVFVWAARQRVSQQQWLPPKT